MGALIKPVQRAVFVAVPYAASCAADSVDRQLLTALCDRLENAGLDVYAAPRREKWGRMRPPRVVGILTDYAALRKCSAVAAFVGTHDADGVLVEIGFAVGLARRLYLLRTGTAKWPAYLDGLVAAGLASVVNLHSVTAAEDVAHAMVRDLGARVHEVCA